MRRVDLDLVRPFGSHLIQRLFGMRKGGGVFDVAEADGNPRGVAAGMGML